MEEMLKWKLHELMNGRKAEGMSEMKRNEMQ